MKKRILSLLLAIVMVLSLIPATVLTANAAGKTMVGIEIKGSGYEKRGSYYFPEFDSNHLVADDGSKQGSYSYSTLCYDEACIPYYYISEEPELGETYYFYVEFSCRSDVVYDVTNANSSIEIDGFSKGRVIDVENDGAFYHVYCSIMYGELTGGVKAVASSVQYDSELGGYAPQFTTLKAVSTEGKELEPIKIQDGQYYYSYYGAESGCLYKTNRGTSFSDKLTTEPQVGETYYSYILLNSIDGNLNIEEELVDIQIPGYDVEYIDCYERDMGFTSLVVYSVTKKPIWVGGVGMFDGDYLAVGATTTTTTQPSGGYAYYKDGKLTLNNYSYEGKGYKYDSYIGAYATVYAERELTVELVGTNTLKQTNYNHDAIFVGDDFEGYLTIQGDGSLNATAGFGISARSTITVNGGTIVCTCTYDGMCTYNQDIIINGGNVTASGSRQYGIRAMKGSVVINGGNATATGGSKAIDCDPSDSFSVAEGMKIQASTTVDGELGEYVAANHDSYKKIVITEKPVDPVKPNPFTDVKEGDFYYAPVLWAVENGITAGATPTTFNPGGPCLRAHVVTFLHRTEGNPEPTSNKNPFTDVKPGDFFYKPVLWAVEKNITSGTSATTFGSLQNCNRAAVVTFLWRAAGSPNPTSTKNPFVDVKSTDFFYKPVLWAVENGITAGLDATHFGPTNGCNRAQVVTFLYRFYN